MQSLTELDNCSSSQTIQETVSVRAFFVFITRLQLEAIASA